MSITLPESNLKAAGLVSLPTRRDARGGLTYAEAGREIPFEVIRVYYLYDVPSGAKRGAHAHKELRQLMIAIGGSLRVSLHDGVEERIFNLTSPSQGLYVPPMLWRDLSDFSPGAVCLVLASDHYSEDDYYRDFAEYHAARRHG